jgi:hypothetical protein
MEIFPAFGQNRPYIVISPHLSAGVVKLEKLAGTDEQDPQIISRAIGIFSGEGNHPFLFVGKWRMLAKHDLLLYRHTRLSTMQK